MLDWNCSVTYGVFDWSEMFLSARFEFELEIDREHEQFT